MKTLFRDTYRIFLFFLCVNLTAQNFANEIFIIENKSIDESSGLASSSYYKNILWTHNDSGDDAILYAMDYKGKDFGSFFMGGEYPNDWEDISSFIYKGISYLLVADTGDNFEFNLQSRLTIYYEPDVYNKNNQDLEPILIINYKYPKNKSYDVESVAVDTVQNKIILLSKRNKKVHVFELPLILDKMGEEDEEIVVAKKIAKLDFFRRPTSMDISRDGKIAIILSYGRVYLFKNLEHKNWKKVLKKPSKIIKFKSLFQPEGIGFNQNATKVYISSETLPARLLEIDL